MIFWGSLRFLHLHLELVRRLLGGSAGGLPAVQRRFCRPTHSTEHSLGQWSDGKG